MINFHQPDFSKFPKEIENMNVETLTTFLEAIKNDFQPIQNEKGDILKEFDPIFRNHYVNLCNYIHFDRFKLIIKFELENELYRFPDVAELLINELIVIKNNDTN